MKKSVKINKTQQQLFVEGMLIGTQQAERVKNPIPIVINIKNTAIQLEVSNLTGGPFLIYRVIKNGVPGLYDSLSSEEEINTLFSGITN